MTRALDWDIKLAGATYMLDEVEGARALTLGKEPKEPGPNGQLGTIVIPSFHHGFGRLVARDPRSTRISYWADTTIPGVVLPVGLTDQWIVLPHPDADNWYDNQGGGACTFHLSGDPSNEEYILFVTAKRIVQLIPSTEGATTVYTLDSDKYAFTGSWARYKESIYFGVESNEIGDAKGRYGHHLVRYNVVGNAWTTVGWVKGSLVEAGKGKIWWVENRGLMGVPQVFWTDDTNFPADPTPTSLTEAIAADAHDGYLEKGGVTYQNALDSTPDVHATVDDNFVVGQYYTGSAYYIRRGHLRFDTSALGSSAIITSVKLRVYLKVDNSATDFLMKVRKYVWETLEAADWRDTPTNDPLVGSKNTSTFPAINNWVEIDLSITNTVDQEGYTELYLLSKEDEDESAPTGHEDVEFEDLHAAGGQEAELVIEYYTAPPSVFAGPFPLESGGYATETSVLGPYVLTCKHDGQVYGVDEEGRPAPIIGPGLTTPGTRFGKGAQRFGTSLLIPHSDGLLSIAIPSLEVQDIHPAKLDSTTIRGLVGSEIGCLGSVGPRLFAGSAAGDGTIVPFLLQLQSYEDGDYWVILGPATTSVGSKPYGMAITKMSDDTLRIYVLTGKDAVGGTRIARLPIPTMGWGTPPDHPESGGYIETPFHLGEGETGPVTKRFMQVRGFARDVDDSNYFTFKFLLDNPSGSYTTLTTVKTEGPFSLAFPASVASLGRSVSLRIEVTANEAGTTFPRLEMPLYIDFEYVPQSTDVFNLDMLCSDRPLDRRGGQRLSDDPQKLLDALRALQGTVTTLEFRGNVGSAWNVLVEKLTEIEKQMPSPQEEPATIARLQIRRL